MLGSAVLCHSVEAREAKWMQGKLLLCSLVQQHQTYVRAIRAFRCQDPPLGGRQILVDLISSWWREWWLWKGHGGALTNALWQRPGSFYVWRHLPRRLSHPGDACFTGLRNAGEQIDWGKKQGKKHTNGRKTLTVLNDHSFISYHSF